MGRSVSIEQRPRSAAQSIGRAAIENVEITIPIGIAPSGGAPVGADQGLADVGKNTVAVIAINSRGDAHASHTQAGQKDVQVAVIVVVAPNRGAQVDVW